MERETKGKIGSVVVTAVFVIVVGGIASLFFWLDYMAYKERFPKASPWTYFFKN